MSRKITSLLLCLLPLALSARVEVEYWMWDSGQLPAYREAARQFEARNPDISIRIVQVGWFDYWISLTTSFLANNAPDAFANHVSRYPELAANGILLDLAPFVERDGLDPTAYLPGLYESWSHEGKQYGIPKDWDTIAVCYNLDMLRAAGLGPGDLENLEWNPQDGGSFGRVVARLTLDDAGRNGLDPDFDPSRVRQYGLIIDGQPDGFGQMEWSHFAVSNGFTFHDGPWSQEFHYDDPRLAEVFTWLREMSLEKHWIIPAREARQIGGFGLFAARRGALGLTGSWMISSYVSKCAFPFGFAPLPVGPDGRKTMFNGLADSIAAGTPHPEEAWRWVSFLGSPEGQMIIADTGVVFPAIREAAERAVEVVSSRGTDVSVFLTQATTPGVAFPFPITERGSDLIVLTRAAMDDLVLGKGEVGETLERLNRDVNKLFKQNN